MTDHTSYGVNYAGIHRRIKEHLGPATDRPCETELCNEDATQWAINRQEAEGPILVDGKGRVFSPHIDDYVPLCAKCAGVSRRKEGLL